MDPPQVNPANLRLEFKYGVPCTAALQSGQRCMKLKQTTVAASIADRNNLAGPVLCQYHANNPVISAPCKAKSSLGPECGKPLVWCPSELQLCPEHLDHPMPCHFLNKLPAEIRREIYKHLLPNVICIPAAFDEHTRLRLDGFKVETAFLRTCRQVYEEASSVLYGARPFVVLITSSGLHIAGSNLSNIQMSDAQISGIQCPIGQPGSALHEYQIQLMLLEQHNKRLVLQNRFSRASMDKSLLSKIRSFVVEIKILAIRDPRPPFRNRFVDNSLGEREHTIYSTSSMIHKLTEYLKPTQSRITSLNVRFTFEMDNLNHEKALEIAQFLLRPFTQLRQIANPGLSSITFTATDQKNGSQADLIDLLESPYLESTSPATAEFHRYVNSWRKEISGNGPVRDISTCLNLLNGLESLMVRFVSGRLYQEPDVVIHEARVACEANDVVALKKVWADVEKATSRYINEQEAFIQSTSQQLESTRDLFKDTGETGTPRLDVYREKNDKTSGG